jgi:hypothetical protein
MSRQPNQDQDSSYTPLQNQAQRRRSVHDIYAQQEWLPNLSHSLFNYADTRQPQQKPVPNHDQQYHAFNHHHSLPPLQQQPFNNFTVNRKQSTGDAGFSHPKQLQAFAIGGMPPSTTTIQFPQPNLNHTVQPDKTNFSNERFVDTPQLSPNHTKQVPQQPPVPRQEDWFVQVKIVNGRYDRVGECWLDEVCRI